MTLFHLWFLLSKEKNNEMCFKYESYKNIKIQQQLNQLLKHEDTQIIFILHVGITILSVIFNCIRFLRAKCFEYSINRFISVHCVLYTYITSISKLALSRRCFEVIFNI